MNYGPKDHRDKRERDGERKGEKTLVSRAHSQSVVNRHKTEVAEEIVESFCVWPSSGGQSQSLGSSMHNNQNQIHSYTQSRDRTRATDMT